MSTLVDYSVGRKLSQENNLKRRKIFLIISIITNIGILFLFKYFNFFMHNLKFAFSLFGYSLNLRAINIVLPVGISFYTFQILSYTIDIYKKKIEAVEYMFFLEQHWQRIKTNNPLERIMQEIRRRTRVVGNFPDGNSALMLVAVRLRHIAGTKWGTKKYLNTALLKEYAWERVYEW